MNSKHLRSAKRSFAASIVITVAACGGHQPNPDAPEVHSNPPRLPDAEAPTGTDTPPSTDTPTGTDTPQTPATDDTATNLNSLDDAVSAVNPPQPDTNAPPVAADLTDNASLPKPNDGDHIITKKDGTCWRYKKMPPMRCPEGASCNPPPPQLERVQCKK